MSRSSPTYHFINCSPFPFKLALACLFLCACAASLRAQQTVRPSVAGETAEELRKPALQTGGYNLKVGPVLMNVSAGMGVAFSDNINLSDRNPEADILVTPAVNIALNWPVTRTNSLSLTTGIGYTEYLFHPDRGYSNVNVSPNSAISFDIYTGDVRINFHDQFSVTDNPITQGALNNVTTYVQYTNVIGVGILWDLNTAILSLDLDQENLIVPQSGVRGNVTQIPDNSNSTQSAVFSASFPISAVTSAGINASAAYTAYSVRDRGTAESFSFGPFYQARLTRYTSVNLSAGYQGIFFHQNGVAFGSQVPTGAQSSSSYFASVSLSHQLNRFYSDSLSFGRESQLGLTSAQEQFYFLSYSANLNLTRRISLSPVLSFNDTQESGGGGTQHYDQVIASVNTGFVITRKLNVSIGYQFVLRLANQPGQGYKQDTLSLQFAYTF